MSKTPEELVEEYIRSNGPVDPITSCEERHALEKQFFSAGYQAAAPQWISVKERLPDDSYMVLIVFAGNMVSVASYEGDWTHPVNPFSALLSVTHWMPLPKPPAEAA